LPEGLLLQMPAGDRVSFLDGERREEQLRESGLPCERIGFVQGELEHVLVIIKLVAKLGHDLLFDFFNLREEFPAGINTTTAEIHLRIHILLVFIFNFSIHNVYSFSSCLFSQI